MPKKPEHPYIRYVGERRISTLKTGKLSLQRTLSAVYYKIAATLHGFNVPQTDELFDEFILGLVFDLAVEAEWISVEQCATTSPITSSDFKMLGSYYVQADLEEEFSNLIGDANEHCWSMYSALALEQRQGRGLTIPRFTTKEQRANVLTEYRSKHVGADGRLPTMKSITGLADVDKRNFKRWRDGELPDRSETSQRINLLLRANIQRGNRKKRKAPTR